MKNLEAIEIDIETAKNKIALKNSLALLRENKYFKEIIVDGYFTYEMNRLVMLKGVEHITPETEASIDKMLSGIGALNNFFNEIDRQGIQMQNELGGYEDTRQEVLAEEIG